MRDPSGTDALRARRAMSFGPAARVYAATRPGYPAEVVRFGVDGVSPLARVADVGAGTGKLTAVLAAELPGVAITAVDPSEGMLAALDAPGVTKVLAPAEATTLADGSADAVFVAQAWHWFDHPRVAAELVRVLRPGGVAVIVMNARDTSVPWVRELSAAMGSDTLTGEIVVDRELQVGEGFGPSTEAHLNHDQRLTVDEVIGLVHSRSHWIVATPEVRAAVDASVRALAARVAVDGVVTLPYRTSVWRAERLSHPSPPPQL